MAVTVRRVRFTAVLVGVVLALTGFSSTGGSGSSGSGSSSGKSGGGKSGGGGGCSSSKSKPKKKSLGSGGNGGGGAASPTPSPSALPAHLELLTCAGPGRPGATVKITSDSAVTHTIRTTVSFEWEDYGVEHVMVTAHHLKPGESRTLDVPLKRAEKADGVQRCALGAVEIVEGASPTPTATTGSTGSSADLPDGKKTSTPKPRSTKKTH
ncbi:hypothetical protein ACODT3_21340 [Streptomyces sp. 4.24]|uniref:hypothetical protein n=1 Tax=Streptomyces tritrimontium TaxID=3406573 RepID=UPI003BB691A2